MTAVRWFGLGLVVAGLAAGGGWLAWQMGAEKSLAIEPLPFPQHAQVIPVGQAETIADASQDASRDFREAPMAEDVSLSDLQAEPLAPQDGNALRLSYAPIVAPSSQAVVNIYTAKLVQSRRSMLMDDPFFRQFFGDNLPSTPTGRPRKVQNSLGSGVILHPDGYIITNAHVVEGADEIKVILADERELDAELLVADEEADLAMLQVTPPEGQSLPFLETADSDTIAVGDVVLAIGNPFGVGQTVTQGIVSAAGRSNRSISDFGFFIQTDAAINPGNSGGALVDMQGRLIGVNTAIFSRSGGSNGIGFAIPANRVRAFFNNVAETGGTRLVRPWSGLVGQTVDADMARLQGLNRAGGIIISDVYQGGPADQAGIKRGDIILEINGKRIRDTAELLFRFSELVVGETANLTIYREGQAYEATMALVEAPDKPRPNPQALGEEGSPFDGAVVINLSPALAQDLKLQGIWDGVMIENLSRYSVAARLGFRPKDVIVGVNGQPIRKVDDLIQAIRGARGEWALRFYRAGQLRSIRLRG